MPMSLSAQHFCSQCSERISSLSLEKAERLRDSRNKSPLLGSSIVTPIISVVPVGPGFEVLFPLSMKVVEGFLSKVT